MKYIINIVNDKHRVRKDCMEINKNIVLVPETLEKVGTEVWYHKVLPRILGILATKDYSVVNMGREMGVVVSNSWEKGWIRFVDGKHIEVSGGMDLDKVLTPIILFWGDWEVYGCVKCTKPLLKNEFSDIDDIIVKDGIYHLQCFLNTVL